MKLRKLGITIATFDAVLAIVLLLILGGIGIFVYRTDPSTHQRYAAALIEFQLADKALTEDLYRLRTGELTHFDTLVEGAHNVLRAEHRLADMPDKLLSSAELNKLVGDVSSLLSRKLDNIEAFKTALATLRAGQDNVAALAEEAQQSQEGGRLPRGLLQDTLNNLLLFVDDASPEHREAVQVQLDQLDQFLAEVAPGGTTSPLYFFLQQAKVIVAAREQTEKRLDAIGDLPLGTACARLNFAYLKAHQDKRIRAIGLMSAILASLFIVFAVLIYATRWRTAKQEIAIAEKQQSLTNALKDARTRTDTLQQGGANDAAKLVEERLTALLRHTFETVAIVSREENFIYLSPAVQSMLGLSEQELIGKSVYEGIHADDLIRVKDYFTRAQKELQTEQTISYRLMDAYGKWHVVETFASNEYSNPAIRGMVINTRRKDDAPNT